ncbi:MAG: SHOCT domain-containing protein [Hyphomicrobiales bacterium]|jgi:putative membrane protein
MNRNSSAIVAVGIAAAMIAAGIWYLYDHHIGMFYSQGRGSIGPGMMLGNGMGIVMVLFWVVLLVALVLVVFGAASGIRNRGNETSDASDALEILKRRYARGEIDKAEYEAKRRDLRA